MHSINVIVSKEKFSEYSLKYNDVFLSTEFEKLPENFDCVIVETDYFGGLGQQSALRGEREYTEHALSTGAINQALADYGIVVKDESQDLFEYCGLSSFRTNKELNDKIYNSL